MGQHLDLCQPWLGCNGFNDFVPLIWGRGVLIQFLNVVCNVVEFILIDAVFLYRCTTVLIPISLDVYDWQKNGPLFSRSVDIDFSLIFSLVYLPPVSLVFL